MRKGFIDDTIELILKEIQSILTIAYILMIGIGMMFNYYKYSRFGINIFEYAHIFDFLIAPFQDLKIILMTIAIFIFTGIVIFLDLKLKKNKPNFYSKLYLGFDKKSWFRTYWAFGFLLMLFANMHMTSDVYGKVLEKKIRAQEKINITFMDGQEEQGIMIGKTSDAVFFLKDEKVKVLTISSSIKSIELN